MRAVMLSGVTGVDDPWHDFEATSSALARIVVEAGLRCDVVPSSESHVAGLADADLLIVNCGAGSVLGPEGGTPDDLLPYLASPRPVLGIHAAANSFIATPAWGERLGVRWIEGVSMHPPIGPTVLQPADVDHEITRGLGAIDVVDERYSFLQADGGAVVLFAHQYRDAIHPLVLAREAHGRRTIYHALGHSLESYVSPSHQRLLTREVRWLINC